MPTHLRNVNRAAGITLLCRLIDHNTDIENSSAIQQLTLNCLGLARVALGLLTCSMDLSHLRQFREMFLIDNRRKMAVIGGHFIFDTVALI
jgi:hypothetical protein